MKASLAGASGWQRLGTEARYYAATTNMPGHRSSLAPQRGESILTCQMGSGNLLALQISPQLLSESQAGQGLGAGRSPTATPPVSKKRKSAGSILPASTCSPAATPNANRSLSFSNSDLQTAGQELRTKEFCHASICLQFSGDRRGTLTRL